MLNIVIPMAGRGSRFANAGYTDPKPLIPLGGKPMIQWVIENVRPTRRPDRAAPTGEQSSGAAAPPHRFIFLCLQEHLSRYPQVPETLRRLCPGCEIVPVATVTEGAACTVLLARDLIDTADPLMIANSDQFVELAIDDYLAVLEGNPGDAGATPAAGAPRGESADGLIMTFWSDHPKWSYCRMDEAGGLVTEVVEKEVVSNEATVGIYNFAHGSDFVRAADTMIAANLRVNGEFYVAPAYNRLIAEGKRIVVARTGREYAGMYGLGLPEDAFFFRSTALFRERAVRAALESDPFELREMTKAYIWAFHTQRMAALEGLMAPEFILEDPAGRFEGRSAVLAYIGKIFRENQPLRFEAHRILVETAAGAANGVSAIQFALSLGEKDLTGVDIIDWRGGQMQALRAWL